MIRLQTEFKNMFPAVYASSVLPFAGANTTAVLRMLGWIESGNI
jgi:hypothetical protein